MLDTAIAQLLEEDKRYPLEAYLFVYQALSYAQNVLEMGSETASAPSGQEDDDDKEAQRHVTGQDLCEAIRQFALEQYGYMAKTVLGRWGISTTGDFGEIVFNLIRIGRMRKTPDDCRADFDDVYDFETALRQEFRIEMPKSRS
jgi:uncharacterized repeat protein (TIGR04138 family)